MKIITEKGENFLMREVFAFYILRDYNEAISITKR